jgi:hypothetical protein
MQSTAEFHLPGVGVDQGAIALVENAQQVLVDLLLIPAQALVRRALHLVTQTDVSRVAAKALREVAVAGGKRAATTTVVSVQKRGFVTTMEI